jgi:hypothetical protein
MTKQTHYTAMARQVFAQFLDGQMDLETLIGKLQEMELQLLADEFDEVEDDELEVAPKTMWFRFFEGDTLRTTIRDMEKDLQNPLHPNADILKRGIAFGLETDELEVHYS